MAVLMIIDWRGASADDYDRVKEAMGLRSDEDAPEGLISHVAAIGDDGEMVVADVWESEEALGRFFETTLGPALKQVGMSEPEPRMLPVHNRLRGSADEGTMVMLIEIADATTDTYDAMTADMDAHAQDGEHPAYTHAAAADGSTIVVVDEWPSVEAFQEFMETQIAPAADKHGMSRESVSVRPLRVHNRIRGKAHAGA